MSVNLELSSINEALPKTDAKTKGIAVVSWKPMHIIISLVVAESAWDSLPKSQPRNPPKVMWTDYTIQEQKRKRRPNSRMLDKFRLFIISVKSNDGKSKLKIISPKVLLPCASTI